MIAETMTNIRNKKVIAIVRGLPLYQMEPLAHALIAGGIDLIEVTFSQNNPDSWKETAQAIQMLANQFDGKIIPGAGTVMNRTQLEMAYEAGANYIISPNLDETVIQRTKQLGLISIPGVFTPSEAVKAFVCGADMVKVFPAGILGPNYIKAMKAPLNNIPMLAVGGINEQNAKEFLCAGAEGLGVGGNLVNITWINEGLFDRITAKAKAYVQVVNREEGEC